MAERYDEQTAEQRCEQKVEKKKAREKVGGKVHFVCVSCIFLVFGDAMDIF